MAITSPDKFSAALMEQLTLLHENVIEEVDSAGEAAIKKLVKLTKASAPEREGSFKRAITYRKESEGYGRCAKFVWGVKSPHHRLTHLLVHGHATRNGGRTAGDPFLEKALNSVLTEYEQDVRRIIEK